MFSVNNPTLSLLLISYSFKSPFLISVAVVMSLSINAFVLILLLVILPSALIVKVLVPLVIPIFAPLPLLNQFVRIILLPLTI